MKVRVGKKIWDKETKEEYEIIYLNANVQGYESVVILSKAEGDQRTEFIPYYKLDGRFTSECPPIWPPKTGQIVWIMNVYGLFAEVDYESTMLLSQVFPTKQAVTLERDKRELLNELKQYSGSCEFNQGCDNFIITKLDNIRVMLAENKISGQVYFESIPSAMSAIKYFGDKLEILF